MNRFHILTAILAMSLGTAHAQRLPEVPVTSVPEAQLAPTGSPNWGKAAVIGPFVCSDGTGMPEARTLTRLCRTAEALYIRVVCGEPAMDKLSASIGQRDGKVWGEDCVEVFLKPPGWTSYAHLAANPLGTEFDERGKDASWNAEWSCTVERGPAAWTVDFRIPFASLGVLPSAAAPWRLNLCRSRRPQPEISAWSPTGGGFHVPERFGVVRFDSGPYPTAVDWVFPARDRGKVTFTWAGQDVADKLSVRVNGAPARGGFVLKAEGVQPLLAEATQGDTLVYRCLMLAEVAPLRGAVAAIRNELNRLPEGHPEAVRIGRELGEIEAFSSHVPPALAGRVQDLLQRLHLEANRAWIRWSCSQAGKPDDGIAYGTESGLCKLLRHEPFGGTPGGDIELDAGRREMACAQVVVFAGDDPLLMMEAEIGDGKGADGAVLPAAAFRIRRVGYVHTCKPVYRVDYVGIWPDPLLAASPFDVAAHSFESLWIDVRVPSGTRPGTYRSELLLSARNAQPTRVPVVVKVRRFSLPARSSISTAFGLQLPPKWRVPQDKDAYIQNFLEHRITPYTVAGTPKLISLPAFDWSKAEALRLTLEILGDSPSGATLACSIVPAGDGAPVNLGPVPVSPGVRRDHTFTLPEGISEVLSCEVRLTGASRGVLSGVLVVDGKERRLWQEEVQEVQVNDGWIRAWPTWKTDAWKMPDRRAVWNWEEFDQTFQRYLNAGITTHRANLRRPLGAWAAEFQRHLEEKGWLDMFYTYLYDEPRPDDYDLVNDRLGQVKDGAPQLHNMMTARQFPPELTTVDIWCPELYSFDPEAARLEQEKGKTIWWYVAFSTRHPYPNVWIDYPALDCRVWPWMTWKHDLDGMLYWSATSWSRNDPWRTGETYHDSNGDGSLFYPGPDGRPVDSIRWECLRDGMEDYEVFCLLEAGACELRNAGKADGLVKRAEALCRIDDTVVRSYRDYNPDPRVLLETRREMSDTLEAIVETLGHEPEIHGRPRRRPCVEAPNITPPPVRTHKDRELPTWDIPKPKPRPGLVLHYAFDAPLPFAYDLSGSGNNGVVKEGKYVDGIRGKALRTGSNGCIEMPAGNRLLGSAPRHGTVALWARPDFDPTTLSNELYKGYAVLIYLMETDGNGLPDGYDEIGIYMHGPRLLARAGGRQSLFASVPNPLRAGQWTHVAIVWREGQRQLFVDGKPLITKDGPYDAPRLDSFRSTLAAHPPHGHWSFAGTLDDVRIYSRTLAPEEIAALAARP